jgi:predicted metal-dependent hydrolase
LTRIEPAEPSFDPDRWGEGDEIAHWIRGVDLFNAGEYEEAHEAFEALWLSTEGPDSDFYKGLVQAAIALHHFQRGNVEGAAKLYGGHRRYLAAYLPAHRGIDVRAFLDEMQAALRSAVRPEPGTESRYDPGSRPRLRTN